MIVVQSSHWYTAVLVNVHLVVFCFAASRFQIVKTRRWEWCEIGDAGLAETVR